VSLINTATAGPFPNRYVPDEPPVRAAYGAEPREECTAILHDDLLAVQNPNSLIADLLAGAQQRWRQSILALARGVFVFGFRYCVVVLMSCVPPIIVPVIRLEEGSLDGASGGNPFGGELERVWSRQGVLVNLFAQFGGEEEEGKCFLCLLFGLAGARFRGGVGFGGAVGEAPFLWSD
jgi:hypothetical protein